MNLGRTVFAQLISFLPDREFRRCVSRYDGDRRWRSFSCWDQFLSMAFAQLTYRESLRDIEACLRSLGAKLYHMGFCSQVARSTLADANESRDWRIYADFAQVLIRIARPLYVRDPIGVDLDQSLYALDSTTIDLCLSLFPWATFRQRKAAVKMHTLLDLRGNIPTFIRITDGKVHDVNILDEIDPEPGAFYVMDRAYVDFERLFVFTLCSSFFVVRTKPGFPFWPWHGDSIHSRCPEYHVSSFRVSSFRAEPCTSPPPVGARARPSAHRRCLSGLNGAPADTAPCETFLEPKTVDPRPGNATHPAQAAPRSYAACRRTAAVSDVLRPTAANSTAHA